MGTKIKHWFRTFSITKGGLERFKRITHKDIGVFLEDLEGIGIQQSLGRYLSHSKSRTYRKGNPEVETSGQLIDLVALACGISNKDTKETIQRKMENLLIQIREGVVTSLKIPKRLY